MSPKYRGKLLLREPTWEILDLERFEEVEVLDTQIDTREQLP